MDKNKNNNNNNNNNNNKNNNNKNRRDGVKMKMECDSRKNENKMNEVSSHSNTDGTFTTWKGVGGTVDSESALRSAVTLLSRV
ncbi:hypothetical protein PoB_002865700 [Plakobranchus ocellatus]|uniref:Uncharacterized protein n=1 Tax=Plakobranchus ocellatus TaxID=259542 RepID=A0AAV4A4D7_9GAST|nr:hypothetical protein PoB_002865700 [Plakobranchus ocellatus]